MTKSGQPSCDAAIVDDAAGALLAHMRRGVLHAEHHAAHQGRHRGVETIDLEALDAAGLGRTTGVVEQAVDPAEFFDRKRDQRLHLFFDGDIGLAKDAGSAELFGQCLALGRAASGDDDPGAFGDENLRGVQPDAAGRACYHRDLAVQPSHFVPLVDVRPISIGVNIPVRRGQRKRACPARIAEAEPAYCLRRLEIPDFRYGRPYFGFADHVK
jgi:hypothetical protein